MRVDDTKNYKRDNPVSMTRRIQNTEEEDMIIFGHHDLFNTVVLSWQTREKCS
jgi:hypothetical protein